MSDSIRRPHFDSSLLWPADAGGLWRGDAAVSADAGLDFEIERVDERFVVSGVRDGAGKVEIRQAATMHLGPEVKCFRQMRDAQPTRDAAFVMGAGADHISRAAHDEI